ncbi:ABC transporter transmembrane domain-containing protein [Serinibacter arcticus]|uniref:Bifunctional ABC transporter n=1 Tax=Serinibacter arcticus TaxID=1655435 RepID=A0A4Z1E064_9MICO|nr:ABC transporter ATP-binding protein [Serinibacter arcticus]TGO05256.1 bifunctional ABC transporter [Serinibacter arcticus]
MTPPPTARTLLRGVLTGGGRRRGATVAALGLTGHQVAEILVPVVIGVVIDAAVTDSEVGSLVLWLGVLTAVFLVLTFSWRAGFVTGTAAFQSAEHELRQRIVATVVDGGARADEAGDARDGAPASPGSAAPGAGTVHSLATSDAAAVAGVIWLLGEQVAAFAALLTAAVTLTLISPPLALAVALGIPLAWVLNRLSHPLERRTREAQRSAAGAASLAADLVAGLRVIAGLGAAAAGARRYRSASAQLRTARISAARAESAFTAASEVLAGLLVAVVGVAAGWLTLRGDLSIGALVAVVGVVQTLQYPISTVGMLGPSLAQKRASATRIAEALSGASSTSAVGTTEHHAPPADGDHLEIAAGDAVVRLEPGALVGLATTPELAQRVSDVLGHRVTARPGEAHLGGADLAALGAAVREHVHAPPRAAHLFRGTLAAAVAAPAPRETDALDARITGATLLDDVVASLPGGRTGDLAAGGANVSGGQRDRIALARALHREEAYLVLHEPLTAVDSVTEAAIAAALPTLLRSPTGRPRGVLLITDSPVLLRACTSVVRA